MVLIPFLIPINLFLSLVVKTIKDQTHGQKADEVEELVLDSIHFGKFSPEIKAELGKSFMPYSLTPSSS